MGQIYKGDKLIMESGRGWWSITVDSALSTTSTNPVQNKVITEKVNELEEWLITHSATAPATPTDWMLWYDETNKVLKIYSEDDAEWKELWEWWVTSINGNTGDITMSTGKITLTQNWEEAGHFFLDQTIDKTIELKGLDKSWKTKTVENGELELWIRTLCYPSADFTLIKPAELVDWEEYVVRFINGSTPFNMTLGHWFTNPFWVDLTLSGDAKDQFTFLAIEWILELQPAPILVAPVENPQAPTWLEATVSGTTWTIKWTDPLDAGTNIWLNTKLVRKVGSAPASVSDWTVLVTNTTRNQYQTTWYSDTWLTAGTTYYYRAFAEFDEGEVLWSSDVNITVPNGNLVWVVNNYNVSFTWASATPPAWESFVSDMLIMKQDSAPSDPDDYEAWYDFYTENEHLTTSYDTWPVWPWRTYYLAVVTEFSDGSREMSNVVTIVNPTPVPTLKSYSEICAMSRADAVTEMNKAAEDYLDKWTAEWHISWTQMFDYTFPEWQIITQGDIFILWQAY